MSIDYQEYEQACEKIRASNQLLLDDFAAYLERSGFSERTAYKHQSNIEFYINEYLLYDDAVPPEEGLNGDYVSMFLGYWFIKKALWASKTSIKSNATSFKKFGKFLFERGQIDIEDFESITEIIREEMPEWLDTLARYDDPSVEGYEDIWEY